MMTKKIAMIGPKKAATFAVPWRWTAKTEISMTMVKGIT